MSKQWHVVQRTSLPPPKPVYDDLAEASAQLLDIRKKYAESGGNPADIILVETDLEKPGDASTVTVTDVTASVGK